MWEKLCAAFPYFAISILAVVSGQIGRLGHRASKGRKLTARTVWIELSMLPAFGSIGGAYAAEHSSPMWIILPVGVAAGWLGFTTFALIASLVMTVVESLAQRYIDSRKGPPR